MINGGQVCVCPAYVVVPDDRVDDFVRSTRSGGVVRNDSAEQMIPSAAPLGGVARRETGAYRGADDSRVAALMRSR
jgi:acyl-CoA reductase-like NAD-dependent aldehyde dehydrogenase